MGEGPMIAAQIRLRLALLGIALRSVDRSLQIVLAFVAVVFGEYTATDPSLWIAPLRPLLGAPLATAAGYLPCLVIALAATGAGVAARPAFEWPGHSRYLAHLDVPGFASTLAQAAVLVVLMVPFAAMLTAGVARFGPIDGATVTTLLSAIALLAAWMRIAAKSLPLATAVVGAGSACVGLVGTRASGTAILIAVAGVTALSCVIARHCSRRFARRPIDDRAPWWTTRSPRVDVWLRLHVDAVTARGPWIFVPTLALSVVSVVAVQRERAPTADVVLFVTGLLLLWQLAALAKAASLAMDGWRESRILRQLPSRKFDRVLRLLLSSAVLVALASPAEAMSLHASGNDAVDGWASLAVATPWIVSWSHSRALLRGVCAWSAIVAVTWVGVLSP